jgi:hypothetical protein
VNDCISDIRQAWWAAHKQLLKSSHCVLAELATKRISDRGALNETEAFRKDLPDSRSKTRNDADNAMDGSTEVE